MDKFLRYQQKGISLEEMQSYNSIHGWNEETDDWDRPGGLAATTSIGGHTFGGSFGAYGENGEVVFFEGSIIESIYDGYLTQPERILARFSEQEWMEMLADGRAYDLDI